MCMSARLEVCSRHRVHHLPLSAPTIHVLKYAKLAICMQHALRLQLAAIRDACVPSQDRTANSQVVKRQRRALTMQRGMSFSSLFPSDCEGMSQSPSPTSNSTRCPTFFSFGASCLQWKQHCSFREHQRCSAPHHSCAAAACTPHVGCLAHPVSMQISLSEGRLLTTSSP